MFCESDQVRLCWDCDGKVHAANFLVAKHSGTLLCHMCHSHTPDRSSNPRSPYVMTVPVSRRIEGIRLMEFGVEKNLAVLRSVNTTRRKIIARHCVCLVVVVRYPDEKERAGGNGDPVVSVASAAEDEEEPVYHDASEHRKACRSLDEQ